MNNYEKAVKSIAPCGLDCSRCVSYKQGDIVSLSRELKEKLTNYEVFAERMKEVVPVLKDYSAFMNILEYFIQGDCDGCRNTDKPKCQCNINSCIKDHNVNFCAECSSFPCTPNSYNQNILDLWKDSNN